MSEGWRRGSARPGSLGTSFHEYSQLAGLGPEAYDHAVMHHVLGGQESQAVR